MKRSKPPCIVVVRYILPAIRAQIAKELIDRYGPKRSEEAKKMRIPPTPRSLVSRTGIPLRLRKVVEPHGDTRPDADVFQMIIDRVKALKEGA